MELDKSPELGEGKAEYLVLSSLLVWDTGVVQAIFVGQKAQGRAVGRIASRPGPQAAWGAEELDHFR